METDTPERLGIKVAVMVNFMVLIVVAIGTAILIEQQTDSLENKLFSKGKQQATIGAKIIATILEKAVENRIFSSDEIFDTNYKKIQSYIPPKYHTRYDTYMDKAILDFQDEFLRDGSILYAVAADLNGYVPTHNSRYQQKLTNNLERDKLNNRTKRIFNDKVGLAAAKNKTPGFRQVYLRDTGEILWDISSPINVQGRHWGCFRLGMSLAAIAEAKRKLSFTLFAIMICVLLASMSLTFFVVNRSLGPVRVLSETIIELAKGQKLQNEIKVTEKDEIGEMQHALERLRLSMLIALRRVKKPSKLKTE